MDTVFDEHLRKFLSRSVAGIFLAVLLTATAATADPLEELRHLSTIKGVTAPVLLHGEVVSERGLQGSFARGAYAESCYFVKAPVAVVGSTLLHWDPSKYKETEVDAYLAYRWPVAPDAFKKFQLSASRPKDRQLLDWTLAAARGEKGNLHLRSVDEELLRRMIPASGSPETHVNAAWQQILRERDAAIAGGGFAAVPSYSVGGVNVRAADEFKNLLKMTPTIATHFAPLTGAKPMFPESAHAADEAVPYAEQSDVNGHTSFCVGVLAAKKTADAWQVLDCSYYTADTYFQSLSLYQLWTWENGTLVWQVDYVSAPFRSYLGGLDRVFAGKELTKESSGSIKLFRRVVESGGR